MGHSRTQRLITIAHMITQELTWRKAFNCRYALYVYLDTIVTKTEGSEIMNTNKTNDR